MSAERYKDQPLPVAWERSRYNPQLVFVLGPEFTDCNQCALTHAGTGCADHPCKGGVWKTEHAAVVLRLET